MPLLRLRLTFLTAPDPGDLSESRPHLTPATVVAQAALSGPPRKVWSTPLRASKEDVDPPCLCSVRGAAVGPAARCVVGIAEPRPCREVAGLKAAVGVTVPGQLRSQLILIGVFMVG